MIYYYVFSVRYVNGNRYFIVNYLVDFSEIALFIYYLDKKHKNNYVICNIQDYHKYRGTHIFKEWCYV